MNARSIEHIDVAYEIFGDHVTAFHQRLLERPYVEGTIRQYIRCIAALAAIMKRDQIPVAELDVQLAVQLINGEKDWVVRRTIASRCMSKNFVHFLNERGFGKQPPPPTELEISRSELRIDYENYLRRQRGLGNSSIVQCWGVAARFLKFRFKEEIGNLSQITPTDARDFIQQVIRSKDQFRNKSIPGLLRNFFRYLFQTGQTDSNLANSVPNVAMRYGQRVPRHLSPRQVELLIQSVKNESPKGRRDYAIMLLLARLGMRPAEVVAIQLDDVDWRSGEILVRGKGGMHDRLPLLPDIGEALVDYIQHGRESASRALFVSVIHPYHSFANSVMIGHIVKEAFTKTGLDLPPRAGGYILRHSLATNLVRQGTSLEEISNLLRHRSRPTALLYAKMDVNGLRSVALPWPKGGAK